MLFKEMYRFTFNVETSGSAASVTFCAALWRLIAVLMMVQSSAADQLDTLICDGTRWRAYARLDGDARAPFSSALSYCVTRNATLATVRTPADQQCFRMAVEKARPGPNYFWIGLNDFDEEARYVWMMDNATEPKDSPNWLDGQPNQDGSNPTEQDCGYANRMGRLGDARCSPTVDFGFICQWARKISPQTDAATTEAKTTAPTTVFYSTTSLNSQTSDTSQAGQQSNTTVAPTTAPTIASTNMTNEGSQSSRGGGVGIAPIAAGVAVCLAVLMIGIFILIHQQLRRKQRSLPVSPKTSKATLTPKHRPRNPSVEADYNSAFDSIKGTTTYDYTQDEARHSLSYDNALYGDKAVSDTYTYALPYQPPAKTEEEIYEQLSSVTYKHIKRDQVKMGTQLGSGNFGDVFHGSWTKSDGSIVQTAIKTLKEGSSSTDRVKFLQEAAVAGQFKHRNVVELYGVVPVGKPVLLVLELMKSDLKSYLSSLSSVNPPQNVGMLFLGMARDIAAGMAYLSSKGFVHRDLAARNVMINDEDVCKIADFGLSRDLADENYYIAHGGKIPVKWTPPEALNYRQFSTASDVWSYGVVLYEIFEFGKKPYAIWSNREVLSQIQAGYRLPQPDACPNEIYQIMLQCWDIDKHQRPTFVKILDELNEFSQS